MNFSDKLGSKSPRAQLAGAAQAQQECEAFIMKKLEEKLPPEESRKIIGVKFYPKESGKDGFVAIALHCSKKKFLKSNWNKIGLTCDEDYTVDSLPDDRNPRNLSKRFCRLTIHEERLYEALEVDRPSPAIS